MGATGVTLMVGNAWVSSDGPFLSADEAAEWKPDWGVWEPAVVGRGLEAQELGGACYVLLASD
jgi:hypothetical protein